MNFVQSAFRWMAESVGAVPRDPMDPRFWGGTGGASQSGEWVGAEQAAQLDVVQAVRSRLAGTISSLPLMVYERIDGQAEDDIQDMGEQPTDVTEQGDGRRPAKSHPLYRLLHDRPNARQTAQEFRSEQVDHLAFWRNSYTRIVTAPDGSPIGSLEQIHPSRLVGIVRDPEGRVVYTFRHLAPATGTFTLRDDEIWHVRMSPLTVDGLRGQYMWETSRETFGKALAVEKFGALYFRNGGSGGGVLEHPGTFKSKEEQQLFLDTWRSSGSGMNRHSDRMLLNGVKYNRFTVNNDDAQFLETMKEVSVKLCRLWNMPPHMVGILDRATFSNIEQQSTEFVMYTLAPYLAAIEQSAARDLLIGADQDTYFVEHNVQGLLRGDWKTRWSGYAVGRQWGWLSANDVRRMENLPPVDGGDLYLSPSNMTPAASVGSDEPDDAPQPSRDPNGPKP